MIKAKELSLTRISGMETSGKQLEMLASFCPNLNHIALYHIHSSASARMGLLRNLSTLVLIGTRWNMLSAILGKVGHNLKRLQISDMVGVLDLSRLSKTCPGLESLLLYEVRKKVSTLPLAFPSLVHLISFDIIDDGVLCPLLESAAGLKELYWRHTSSLGDSEMANIFCGKGLMELEVFSVMEAPSLGLQTLDMLMLNCQKLQTIGAVDSWNFGDDVSKILVKKGKERWRVDVECHNDIFYSGKKFIHQL